ncbi:MAG: HEAT repeat domain-containing protein [Bacteroidota bacterium]
MNHHQYKELLQLSIVQELEEEEQQVLQRHLDTCGECRQELGELEKFSMMVRQQPGLRLTDELLNEARQELRVALRLERSRRSVWEGLQGRFQFLTFPRIAATVGGVAMLAAGVLIGRLGMVQDEQNQGYNLIPAVSTETSLRGETRVSNVRFLSAEPIDGKIEFTFEAITPIRMRGEAHDPGIQRILAQGLMNEQNPGTRLRTVSTLASFADQSSAPDPEIKTALIQALKSDVNVGVRKEALRVLQKFPLDHDIRDALLYVLRLETNPAMRIDVINVLEKPVLDGRLRDDEVLNVLREKMQSDNNNYIRLRARNVYEEVQQQ